MHKFALILHLLGASIWVGGHLYLLIRLMPKFVKNRDVAGFLQFEKSYEPLGMAAFAVQIITGLYMMNDIVPINQWGQPLGFLTALMHAKFTWLGLTIITAIHARFRIIPRLMSGRHTPRTLPWMAVHVGLICLWSVAFVITGAWFR